jgi:hypothetical protein
MAAKKGSRQFSNQFYFIALKNNFFLNSKMKGKDFRKKITVFIIIRKKERGEGNLKRKKN